jgi:methionine-rich copper-binding protein CopC
MTAKSGRSRLAGLLGVVATALALVATASPASAHAQLETMNPGPGATLKELPGKVVLSFSEDVRTPAFVQVTSPDGVDVAEGDVSIVDDTVTQTLGRPAGAGRYSVSYRITSADGHPVGGTVDFQVLSDAGAGGAATSPRGDGSPQSATDDSGGIDTSQLLLLLAVLVVGLAALVYATRRALGQSVAMVEERKRAEESKATKGSPGAAKKRGRAPRR